MISLSDQVLLKVNSDAQAREQLMLLCLALRERFDNVNLNNEVLTSSSSLLALVFRGRRTHPMLPFDRARFELKYCQNQWFITYDLSLKALIITFLYLTAGIGILSSIDNGLLVGISVSFLFVFTVMVVSFFISARRAKKWIIKTFN